MVSRMPGEGKGDTSSESGQVNATEAISNINRVPTLKEVFGAALVENTRLLGDSQATENWSTVTIKKRKLQTPGRPIGAVSKVKTITRDVSQSIFSFSSQTQQSTRGASDAPASTQPNKSLRMDCDFILPIYEI
jgi:hypothetical protein